MLTFKADDGYSYLISKFKEGEHPYAVYRIDSEETKFQLGTNERVEIKRLGISSEVSIKLKNIRESLH